MKKIVWIVCVLSFAPITRASNLNRSLEGKGYGITENNHHISKIFRDSSGKSEILTVFKAADSKVSWQLEYRGPDNKLSSRLQKFRDGSEAGENYGADEKVVSRFQTDRNGKTTTQNF